MKIEEDVKLDYSDVLIRPKRSTLVSRNDVDLNRTIEFPISKQTWTGVPIIAANMDTIGTYDVYKVLSTYKIITAFFVLRSGSNVENFGWPLYQPTNSAEP